jgi:hypothetical protein
MMLKRKKGKTQGKKMKHPSRIAGASLIKQRRCKEIRWRNLGPVGKEVSRAT